MKLNSKRVYDKLLCSILVGLVLINAFWIALIVEPVSASPSLPLKWSRSLGSKGATLLSPLAADLNKDGKMEIVLTGSSSDWSSDGMITALDGATGAILWQKTSADYPNIGVDERTAFDIADLDKDGIPEIIIPSLNGPLVLHGNDGSLYWRRTDVPSASNFGAVADVDGDGYPEIFVSRGLGPKRGYDYITELSHDGNVMHQAWLWHTCWGGLSVGDPKNDGQFILLQGERSNAYSSFPPSGTDIYAGGGLGARALDANTLTPLWNDPTVLDSSQAPMLADVDKDGILDVVTVHQLSGGTVAVYNSTDGSVLTTGGKYRKGGTTRMGFHSQPAVYDIDYDGNLEIISGRDSNPRIWDLYDWKDDGVLPIAVHEPPTLGYMNNDNRIDIIAAEVSKRDVYIYTYDSGIKNYTELYHITGVSGVNAFSLVQDIDGDNLNELVLSSASGRVYAYDTPAPAPNPRARSGLQFYNEYKTDVAEYVSPPIPSQPVVRDEYPQDRSYSQGFNPTLSVLATDFQGNSMTITFRNNASGAWQDVGTFINVPNGRYSAPTTNMNKPGTTYYWGVTVADGINSPTSKVFKFTTSSNPPTQTDPTLTKSAGGDLVAFNQTTADYDGNKVANIYDWYVNGVSIANLHLPFDTQTSGNPLVADLLFSGGFENGFDNWNGNGITNWITDTSQKHSGNYSARASSTSTYLTSDNLDTSYGDGITVGFWYRRSASAHSVNLQLWAGSSYITIVNLGTSVPINVWQHYSIQSYYPGYLRKDFRVRIDATALTTGEYFWIDDFSITTPTQAKDYSGYNNNAMIRGATWTPQGVVGGAYVFDGASDYMKIRDDPSLGGNGTWSEISAEFWIKLNAPMTGATVIAKKVASESAGGYMIGFRDASSGSPANTLYWSITNGTYYDPVRNRTNPNRVDVWDDVNTVLSVGSWYHVVATYKSGQGLTIYINGTQRVNKPLTGNIFVYGQSIFGAPLFVGWDGGTNVNNNRYRWLNGTLDEIMIYPQALTPRQITQRYLETKDGSSSSSTIVSEETTLGETWRAKVTPNDSFGDGVIKFSNPLTITEPPVQYELVIDISGSGTTNPSPDTYTYNSGTDVIVTAIPDGGMTLDYWLKDGLDAGNANPITVKMDTDHTLTAVFTQDQYTLTVNTVGSGSVTKNPNQATYTYGTIVTLTASPVVGWSFADWSGDASGSDLTTTVTMTSDKTVTATFTQDPYTLTVNIVGTGSVTRDPDQTTYAYGNVVTLTAAPGLGWSFGGWSGDSSGSDLTTTVTMNDNKAVTATFTQNQYTLTVNTMGNGFVSKNPDQETYTYGTVVTLTASPDLGWNFVGWSGDASGSEPTTTVTMNGNRVVTATFTDQYTLTVDIVGDGSVTKDPDQIGYAYGTVVTLTATPDLGWSFVGWSGDASGNELTTTVTMTGNKEVTATFTDQYTLTVNIVGDGSVTRDPDQATYTYGTVVTLTASPSVGWSFAGWSGDATGTDLTITVTIDGNRVVTATFIQDQYTLTVNIVGSGSVAKNPDQATYTYGTIVTLTAYPDLGSSFTGWSGDASGSGLTTTVTMTGNKAVTATFTLSATIFSDDFESGNFVNWDSTTTTSGETATAVSSRYHHGSYSGRFTSNGGAGTEQAHVSKAVDVSEVYVRGYFYIDGSLPLNDNGDRFYFIRLLAANGQTGLAYAGIRRDGGVDKWVLYTLNGYTAVWTYAQSPLPQNGAWYSVELHWKLHSNTGVVELYVDGVKIIQVTGINTAYFGNARRVDFGLVQATGVQKSLTIFGDCAVIAQSYIGPEATLLSMNLMSAFEGTFADKFRSFALVYPANYWFGILLLLLTLASQTMVFDGRLFTRSKKKRSGIKLQP
jgi:uncharacterized repeat protein (TIGR02543 family)